MEEKKYRWFKIFDSGDELNNNVASGATYTLEVDRKKICLVHGTEGIFAIRDKCPHNGFPLSQGKCTDQNSIVCPAHRYHFDLKTGKALSGMAIRVETYPIKIADNGVFLGVEEYNWWPF